MEERKMAAFYTLARGATFPRAATTLVPRATARHQVHRTPVATAIRGAIGQVMVCVWSLLALGLLLLVLAGFFAR
jgi:formate/nitrite transporter FocA (FNT family)